MNFCEKCGLLYDPKEDGDDCPQCGNEEVIENY